VALVIQGIHALIDAAVTEPYRFPPTLLHSEGWMLRLILDWFHSHEIPDHPLSFHQGATWFLPTLERMTILPLAWERLTGDIQGLDESTGQDLATFYAKCLEYD